MKTYCTNPNCSQPINHFPKSENSSKIRTDQQEYCRACGMEQILAGRYIPHKLLGRGGFGAAYQGYDRHTPRLRQCVLKQFRPSNVLDEKTLKIAEELFAREAEVLETLGNKHPQIPDLYAFFTIVLPQAEDEEEKQFFYIVQEFVDGETLEEELERKGKLNETEVREILENMLKILQFVHENKSIHRDIKPSNIVRDRAGTLYLLDFGAVKLVRGASTKSRSTGIYSAGYAPHEQMYGDRVYPSTDLYALAATCLRLLTGKPIHDLYDSYHGEWRWRDHADQVSEKLAAILDRMLLPVPKDRFQSAQGILKVLEQKPVLEQETRMQPPDWELALEQGEAHSTDWRSLLQEDEPTQFSQPADWREMLKKETSVTHPTDANANGSQSSVPEPPPLFPPPDQPKPKGKAPRFALWELLASAGFTGFEGALFLIALSSIFSTPAISIGLWGMSMGGLVYAQWQRIIEKIDFLMIGGVTLALIILLPPLHSIHDLTRLVVIIASVTVSAGAIALTTLFKLIYNLLSRRR